MVSEPCGTAETTSAFGVRAERPEERAERELLEANAHLRAQVEVLELRVQRGEERRRAMLHIMGDLNQTNKRLSDQRRAMLHILVDYEQDRRRLARQTELLDKAKEVADLVSTTDGLIVHFYYDGNLPNGRTSVAQAVGHKPMTEAEFKNYGAK